MNTLTEPTEIDLYDFPWQAPLTEVEVGCFAARRYNTIVEPDDLSVLERKLFEANPEDFEWARERIKDLPDYLTKYFVTRYISVFEKKSRREANIFLRERMGPAAERALMVLRKYKKLPTTQKVSLLSEEFSDTEQSDFANNKQAYFDFDKVERNRKPVKSRLLAELEPSEIKEMAFKISVIVDRFIRLESDKYHAKTELGTTMAVVFTYEQVAKFVTDTFGVKPPRKYKEQSELSALQDISKLISEKWWCGRLNKIRKIMREHLAIAMGQVSSKASPYASWDCVREHQAQQTANYEYIKQCQLLDEETGEEADLWDMVKKSVANPAIRRHELMVRCRGCEDIGNELGLQGLFLTLTTPAKYHNSYKKGGFIGHWNGASPRDAQTYLNNVWQRIRAKLGRKDIRWFGVRVAEPHHDGTPHWHLLIWVKPEDKELVTEIFVDYATKEDKHELFDKQGKFDHSARCDVGEIDPEKGTATGYIAKYISKNIDGFAMDDEVSDETGKSVKDMAKNVSAWKSRWNIRQFQFFGGAPVTTYRELRRFANQNKKAFMEYLFMQERVDLLTIYSMLQRDLVGPIKPSKLITNEELMKVIGDSYQARTKSEDASITDTLKAADHGNWQGYIMGQGGPFVKREDLLIVNSYEVLPFASPHGEDVRKIEGFATPEETIKTRTKVWTIQKKSKVNEDVEACALGSEATAFGASGSSRSSVNNCTEPEKVQVCDQLTRLLAPNEILANSPPNIDEFALNALLKGSSLKVDNETSLQIRPAEIDEHGNKRPAQLVEVSRAPADDLKWMDFEGWDQLLTQPEQVKDEYQQPDLSFFPELESDWPLA
ncbi:TPA: replication endonuclease [Vibrio parahaemolyticus]|uniref:replication endonuclease n=1 Tax=Vibrio parahaemolyticus TaxID=670 RepID=UPI000761B041|nr:replication endonuclease [Vibrio parahaemolyticus]KWU34645.1 replication protein [Vibrio parahaemolyticus]MQF76804.1 replication endonuclease [Vibrio parahaemolyticus]HCE4768791.1 replication endonuclease [Vibrio parahaemolyticus]HCG5712518.1 replication endonuclease [Vibrio parahaemolyticus]HCG8715093.1 replication endonuclease [Vibrio parahaemolyticus]